MNIVSEALMFATSYHLHQHRKGTRIPYMAHLLNACKILAEKDCEDDILAAALLHDLVEDTPVTIEEVEEKFGSKIANIVRGCTEEYKLEKKAFSAKGSWKARKEHTIHFLETAATQDQLLVIIADKLDNLRSIYYDYQLIGEEIWQRFNAPKEEQQWYYESLTEAMEKKAVDGHPILQSLSDEMRDLCNRLFIK